MGFFSSTVAAVLAGQTVHELLLAKLDFDGDTRRLFAGFGDLVIDGETWQGAGEFVQVSAIPGGGGSDAAQALTLTLSGIDPGIAALAFSEANLVRGRPATLYLAFVGDNGLLDPPAPIWLGQMDRIKAGGDIATSSVTLHCEGWFTARTMSPNGLYSSRDQEARHPGDKGLEFMPTLTFKTAIWPAS